MKTQLIRTIIITLALLVPVLGLAQSYQNLDYCGLLNYPDRLNLYFDEATYCECGGILMDPFIGCQSTSTQVSAWIVLTNPTADAITGWQFDLRMEGDVAIQGFAAQGGTAIASYSHTGDTWHVQFNEPLPLAGAHTPLLMADLLLAEGGNPYWYEHALVEFFLAPAGDAAQLNPGYFDGSGQFVPCHSLTSQYNGWGRPCMTLNGLGVTETEAQTWDRVKAIYR